MKRLILLSKNFTAQAHEKLSQFCGKADDQIKIAFCRNAADLEANTEYVESAKQELLKYGYKVKEFDLNLFCNHCSELSYLLQKFDATFFTGGSANYLIYLFNKTGLVSEYKSLVESGKLIHIGFSAGAMICSPHMKYAQIIDDTNGIAQIVDQGLNLTNLHFVPHYADKPKYTKKYEDIIKNYALEGDIIIPLTNNQAIVVEGDNWEII
jgi:dipeptidase E